MGQITNNTSLTSNINNLPTDATNTDNTNTSSSTTDSDISNTDSNQNSINVISTPINSPKLVYGFGTKCSLCKSSEKCINGVCVFQNTANTAVSNVNLFNTYDNPNLEGCN